MLLRKDADDDYGGGRRGDNCDDNGDNYCCERSIIDESDNYGINDDHNNDNNNYNNNTINIECVKKSVKSSHNHHVKLVKVSDAGHEDVHFYSIWLKEMLDFIEKLH